MSDRRWLAHVEDTAALIALREGRAEAALEMTERDIGHAEATGNDAALISADVTKACAHARLGQVAAARESCERAYALTREALSSG